MGSHQQNPSSQASSGLTQQEERSGRREFPESCKEIRGEMITRRLSMIGGNGRCKHVLFGCGHPESIFLSSRRTIFSQLGRVLKDQLPNETDQKNCKPSMMIVPVVLSHGALGSLLSYPVIADALTREYGVVASAELDWDIVTTSVPLSLGLMIAGIVGSSFGEKIAAIGPRKAVLCAALSVGSGLAVSAVGVYFHMLPMLYIGFGVGAGVGAGMCYVSQIQTLMQWFPDYKGISGGIAVSSMGLGAVLGHSAVNYMLRWNALLPEYLGPLKSFEIINESRESVTVNVEGKAISAVNLLQESITQSLPFDSAMMTEGLYALGSGGTTGAVPTLIMLGLLSFSSLTASSFFIRSPPKDYAVDNIDLLSPAVVELTGQAPKTKVDTEPDLGIADALRSRSFHALGAMIACTTSSGVGLIALSDPIMNEAFAGTFPDLISPSFLDHHFLGLCCAGIFGASFWSTLSDAIGCRKSLVMMHFITMPCFVAIPICISGAIDYGSSLAVYLSVGASAIAVTSLGGILAVTPAYCAELFGKKNLITTHGGMMGYMTLAALIAPYMYEKLHMIAESDARAELIPQISLEKISEAFQIPLSEAHSLLESGSLSLSAMASMVSPDILDPVPQLYQSTLYTFAGLVAISALSNGFIVEPSRPRVKREVDSLLDVIPRKPEKVIHAGRQVVDRRRKKKRNI